MSTRYEYEFEAAVAEWSGPEPFQYVPLPAEVTAELRTVAKSITSRWGMIPVTARIGATVWTTSLWPRDGGHVLPMTETVRRSETIDVDDVVAADIYVHIPDPPDDETSEFGRADFDDDDYAYDDDDDDDDGFESDFDGATDAGGSDDTGYARATNTGHDGGVDGPAAPVDTNIAAASNGGQGLAPPQVASQVRTDDTVETYTLFDITKPLDTIDTTSLPQNNDTVNATHSLAPPRAGDATAPRRARRGGVGTLAPPSVDAPPAAKGRPATATASCVDNAAKPHLSIDTTARRHSTGQSLTPPSVNTAFGKFHKLDLAAPAIVDDDVQLCTRSISDIAPARTSATGTETLTQPDDDETKPIDTTAVGRANGVEPMIRPIDDTVVDGQCAAPAPTEAETEASPVDTHPARIMCDDETKPLDTIDTLAPLPITSSRPLAAGSDNDGADVLDDARAPTTVSSATAKVVDNDDHESGDDELAAAQWQYTAPAQKRQHAPAVTDYRDAAAEYLAADEDSVDDPHPDEHIHRGVRIIEDAPTSDDVESGWIDAADPAMPGQGALVSVVGDRWIDVSSAGSYGQGVLIEHVDDTPPEVTDDGRNEPPQDHEPRGSSPPSDGHHSPTPPHNRVAADDLHQDEDDTTQHQDTHGDTTQDNDTQTKSEHCPVDTVDDADHRVDAEDDDDEFEYVYVYVAEGADLDGEYEYVYVAEGEELDGEYEYEFVDEDD